MAQLRIDDATLLDAVRSLTAIDRDLRAVVARHGPPPLWAREPGFLTLVQIILEQQVSLASGRAAYERLEHVVPVVRPDTLAQTDPAILEAAGLTRQKTRYLRALAQAIVDGSLDLDEVAAADDAEARQKLCKLPGIGPWTADVYLLMALGRPDAWPAADIALMSSMARVKGLAARATETEMAEHAEPWRPWRAVAARILWHAYLSERKTSAAAGAAIGTPTHTPTHTPTGSPIARA